jgi:hypothetical protein
MGEGLPGLPGRGITGVVPGSGTGAGICMRGSISEGGGMTPSVRPSLSVNDGAPGEALRCGSGSIFSGMTLRGSAGVGASIPAWASSRVLVTSRAETASGAFTIKPAINPETDG